MKTKAAPKPAISAERPSRRKPQERKGLKNPGSGKPNAVQKAKQAAKDAGLPDPWTQVPEEELDQQAKATGKPVRYTPELGARICRWIASGAPMWKLWEQPGIPAESTIYRWRLNEGKEYDRFRQELARAREARAETRAGKIEAVIDRLVDAPRPGELPLHPQAAKVFVEGQRILMEVEAPKKYGRQLTLKGDPKAPLVTRTLKDYTDEELMALAQGGIEAGDD